MSEPSSRLTRTLGLPGSTIFGLAAMLGTGVFVVWGPASLLAGGALIGAVVLAGLVASANAWSTVQLAVLHPESGGAYTYGRIRIHRLVGIVAGVAFIVGKTASAAAAALAIGLYLFPDQARFAALGAVLLALVLDMRGIRRSVQVSAVLVTFVIVILLTVSATSLRSESVRDISLTTPGAGEFFAASALCFFAFAGYARITVLGEEVQDPVRTIPRAVMTSLLIVACVYLLVATAVTVAVSNGVTLSAAGLLDLVEQNPPLAVATRIGLVVAAGAALLALLAGISRMVFAMAAAGDAPAGMARVTGGLPRRAQVVAALGTAVIVLAGQLSWAIALSAGSVLLYYSVAHVAAMRIDRSPVIPVLGLIGCVGLVASLVVWGPVGL